MTPTTDQTKAADVIDEAAFRKAIDMLGGEYHESAPMSLTVLKSVVRNYIGALQVQPEESDDSALLSEVKNLRQLVADLKRVLGKIATNKGFRLPAAEWVEDKLWQECRRVLNISITHAEHRATHRKPQPSEAEVCEAFEEIVQRRGMSVAKYNSGAYRDFAVVQLWLGWKECNQWRNQREG